MIINYYTSLLFYSGSFSEMLVLNSSLVLYSVSSVLDSAKKI